MKVKITSFLNIHFLLGHLKKIDILFLIRDIKWDVTSVWGGVKFVSLHWLLRRGAGERWELGMMLDQLLGGRREIRARDCNYSITTTQNLQLIKAAIAMPLSMLSDWLVVDVAVAIVTEMLSLLTTISSKMISKFPYIGQASAKKNEKEILFNANWQCLI